MPKPQPKPSPVSRFGRWLAHHKVITVFLTLSLAIFLFFAISALTLAVQTHFERERYLSAQNLLNNLSAMVDSRDIKNEPSSTCTYNDNGGGFRTQTLGCQVSANINFQDAPESNFDKVDGRIKGELQAKKISVNENQGGMEAHDLSNFIFTYKGIACGFSTTYYSADVPANERHSGALQDGADLYVSIGCSGPARTPYFPVIKD